MVMSLAQVNSLTSPLIRKGDKLEASSWDEALNFISEKIKAAKPDKCAALGGNTLTTEENYLFQKLTREVIGSPHVDHRIGEPVVDSAIQKGMEISIGECEKS